jgi:hypothetical protein
LFHFYRIYVLRIPTQVFYFSGWFIEILLSIERLRSIHKKGGLLTKLPVAFLVMSCVLFYTAISIPVLLSDEIIYSGNSNLYLITPSKIGQSSWFLIYVTSVFFASFLVMAVGLFILNFKLVRAIYLEISKRRKAANGHAYASKNLILTRIIIFINTYFILIRLNHLVSFIVFRLEVMKGINYSVGSNLFKEIAFLLLGLNNCMSIFVYAYFDKAIRNRISRHFETHQGQF